VFSQLSELSYKRSIPRFTVVSAVCAIMNCTTVLCVFKKVSVLVLVEIRFANTGKSIGNTNTNTYFQKLLQYFGNTENGSGNIAILTTLAVDVNLLQATLETLELVIYASGSAVHAD